MDSPPTFASPAEESAFWRSQAEEYRRRYEESAEELEEFQISSRELEAELEAQLEQAETKVRELTSANQRLQMEYENLAERNHEIQSESQRQINSLAEDLGSISKSKEDLVTYVRELEMSNDSLENSKRQTISTLEDFEQRLNHALERNAYLESELEEKDQLNATIQRLKDESRDIRLEMSLKKTRSPSNVSLPPMTTTTREAPVGSIEDDQKERRSSSIASSTFPIIPNGPEPSTTIRQTPSPSNSRSPSLSSSSMHGFPGLQNGVVGGGTDALTPTARITALNIVGDLLRKVGSLESKLASCRTTSLNVSGSPIGSPMVVDKQRATTIGADFSPASHHHHHNNHHLHNAYPTTGRPRANAVSAPTFVNCENYV